MSREEVPLPYMDEITNVGLGVSIISLIACLGIYVLVWNSVVRSNVSYFRLTAYINISLCLLIADCCFLASSPKKIPESWCQILVVLKHFFYLAMFFWMLCLSLMVLHKTVFVFHKLSKKAYLGFSFFLGYFCPVLIVAITFITYQNGNKDSYYSAKTCWLIYEGVLKGSIHSFVLPIGTIVVINVFCMMVVITRLLNPVVEASTRDEKDVAKSILRLIVLLTPIFGVTWLLGFFVLTLDLTVGALAIFVNYAFTLLNAFQGFFLLLTSCVGEKMVRDALFKRVNIKV
ncbi:adhesion G-protein coupled receptor F3 [Aplochiton taeniatus]